MDAKRAEMADRVCDMVAQGESLRESCRQVGIPASSFLDLVAANKDLRERYARSRERGLEIEFEALRDLAAEPPPLDANGRADSGWVNWKRLQIDTAKWTLSKKQPQKYGDKIETTHQVGDSVNKIVREIIKGG